MINAIVTGSVTGGDASHPICQHEPGSRYHQLDSVGNRHCVRLPRNEGLWQLP